MQKQNNIAFKEWAVVVKALGQGRQILIVRKGGIHERGGQFQPEHKEFFLFPTYVHQTVDDLLPEAAADMRRVQMARPDPNTVAMLYYAVTHKVSKLDNEKQIDRLEGHHVWRQAVLHERLTREPKTGLYMIAVRVYRLPEPIVVEMTKEYRGCTSWVELSEPFATKGAEPVLSDAAFKDQWKVVAAALKTK